MLNQKPMTKQQAGSWAGMALGEYAMIGTLVLCVCIMGFMGIGNNLSAYFLGLKGSMQQQTARTQASQVAVTQAVSAIEEKKAQEEADFKAQAAMLRVDPSNPNALCGSNWCVEAPGLTGKYVSTAGSNGNQANSPTNVASNIYAQMAKVMENQEGADPGLIALLTDMANRGHGLADSEYQLTSSGGDYYGMKGGADGILQNLAEFKQMSKQLDQSMSQFPPDVQVVLNNASRVIVGIGDSFDIDLAPVNGRGNVRYTHYSRKISLVHSESNNICGSGGNQQSCMR